MKKFLSIILSVLMLIQLSAVSMAAGAGSAGGSRAKFEFIIPVAGGDIGSYAVIDNVEGYAKEEMQFGLLYASDWYSGSFTESIRYSFTSDGETTVIERDETPLKRITDSEFILEIPVFESLAEDEYVLDIYLPVALDKGSEDVLPFLITIPRFVVGKGNGKYFEIHRPLYSLLNPAGITINGFEKWFAEEMKFGLLYASDAYGENITEPQTIEFKSTLNTYSFEFEENPLKHNTDGTYTLKVPQFSGMEAGVYKTTIIFPIAQGKEIPEVKPYKLVFYNMVVGTPANADWLDINFMQEVKTSDTDSSLSLNISPYVYAPYKGTVNLTSDLYKEYITDKTYFTLKRGTKTWLYSTDKLCLKKTENDNYILNIPHFGCMENGKYSLSVELPYANVSSAESGDIFPMPVVVNFESFTINNGSGNHVWELEEVIEPGCEADGLEVYKCKYNCGNNKYEDIPSIGHSFTPWHVEISPTSTETGLRVRRCANCFDEETEKIEVLDHGNTLFTVKDTVTREAIEGAEVTVSSEDVEQTGRTGADGKVYFDLANGVYNVSIIKQGYQLRSFTIEKMGEESEFTPYLNKDSVLKVETSAKEMTREEIIDAGIDVEAEENQHVYKCVTVLKFTPVDSTDGSLTILPIEVNFDYYCDDAGSIIKAKPVKAGTAVIYPVSRDIYLIIHSSVNWLKEMFDIQLIASNTSSVETIKECVADLDLPEGLSLAVMTEGEQSVSVALGDIAPGEQKDVHWYLKGDKVGEYFINGTVSGTRVGGGISENISESFTTSEAVSVLAGNAMKLTIEAERMAEPGKIYRARYTLQNVSDKNVNNVSLSVLGGKFVSAYAIEEILAHEVEIGETDNLYGSFNDGCELRKDVLAPGEVLSGVFEILFGIGVETEEDVKYMVTDMFTMTGAGSTTEIPTEIVLVDRIEGHLWNRGIITKHSTLTERGIITYTCTECGKAKDFEVPSLRESGNTLNLAYKIYKDGKMFIDGSGKIESDMPWAEIKDEITVAEIEEGITELSEGSFSDYKALKEVRIPKTVEKVGEGAFENCEKIEKVVFGAGRDEWEKISIGAGNEYIMDENMYYKNPSVKAESRSIKVYAPEEKCRLLIVTYNEGVYVDQTTVEVDSSIDETLLELGIDLENTDKVKVFLWKGTEGMKPLCKSDLLDM